MLHCQISAESIRLNRYNWHQMSGNNIEFILGCFSSSSSSSKFNDWVTVRLVQHLNGLPMAMPSTMLTPRHLYLVRDVHIPMWHLCSLGLCWLHHRLVEFYCGLRRRPTEQLGRPTAKWLGLQVHSMPIWQLEPLDLESLPLDSMAAAVVSCFVQSLPHNRATGYCSHVPENSSIVLMAYKIRCVRCALLCSVCARAWVLLNGFVAWHITGAVIYL